MNLEQNATPAIVLPEPSRTSAVHSHFHAELTNGARPQGKLGKLLGFVLLITAAVAAAVWVYQRKQTKPGDMKTITLPGGAPMELVYCPGGEFAMGSATDDRQRNDDETLHTVKLSKGFWISRYEVTQRQWKSVMGSNPSRTEGEDLPVDNVSWGECNEFCQKAGNGLRLPTEAQWEFAARGGPLGKGCRYSGSDSLADVGWYYENSGDKPLVETEWDIGSLKSNGNCAHPVNVGKKGNELGIFGMSGNLCEWCADWYESYPKGSVIDPAGPASGEYRVIRGGSWYFDARRCRVATRARDSIHKSGDDLGFRVCVPEDYRPPKPVAKPSEETKPANSQSPDESYDRPAPTAPATAGQKRNRGYRIFRGPRAFVKKHIDKNDNCRVVALTETGGDIVVSGKNNWACDRCTQQLGSEMQKITDLAERIVDVNLTESGRYLVLYGKNNWVGYGIPNDMIYWLTSYRLNGERFYSATFNDGGDWILVTSEHYACSATWLKQWLRDGHEKFGLLNAAAVSSDAAVAVYERGFKFFGNVPADLKKALREADFDVRIVKMAGSSWFFADSTGNLFQYNM